MPTQPTNLPVPSESPRDLKFNAGKIDEFVTSLVNTYIDRFGHEHYTIEGLKQLVLEQIYSLGWNLVGTFQAGAVVYQAGDIVQDTTTNIWYRWDDLSSLPKTVPPGSTPASAGGVGQGKWQPVDVSDVLKKDINLVTRYFSNVSEMVSKGGSIGQRVVTHGYYTPGDGGGAEYLIKAGAPLQDYTDAGSVVIDASKFAWLMKKDTYNFQQFGVKIIDESFAEQNDAFIVQAVTRSRFGYSIVYITSVIYHKKPIVLDYYNHIEGMTIGSDPAFTPRFVKVDKTTSGIPSLAYPGVSDLVPFDVDAGIIIKRQNAATPFTRGIVVKGFTLQSSMKSDWAIYAPHLADFDIEIDSRGFNGGIRFNVAFLGKFAGRHVGLAAETGDPALAFGLWADHFSTTLDCGNSVAFRLSFNGYTRGMQVEYFGNGSLDRVTFENIKKHTTSSPTPFGFQATNSWFNGEVSCESSAACILRIGSNSNIDVNLSAVFHVTQDSTAEGVIHVLSGGRLNLRPSTILADAVNTRVINEAGGYLDISANTRLANISLISLDSYRFKNRMAGFGQTTATTGTSFASGTEVTFSSLNGTPNATLSGGTIQFNAPALVRISVFARGVSSGTLTFGMNGASEENASAGQTVDMVKFVTTGDILNIKAVGSLTLSSTSGLRVSLTPVL